MINFLLLIVASVMILTLSAKYRTMLFSRGFWIYYRLTRFNWPDYTESRRCLGQPKYQSELAISLRYPTTLRYTQELFCSLRTFSVKYYYYYSICTLKWSSTYCWKLVLHNLRGHKWAPSFTMAGNEHVVMAAAVLWFQAFEAEDRNRN